jgi:hypothetical protein
MENQIIQQATLRQIDRRLQGIPLGGTTSTNNDVPQLLFLQLP